MILPYEASKEVHEFLTEQNIPYVIIGGIAIQRWGNPRLTKDVDATLLVPLEEIENIITRLTKKFPARIQDTHEFVLRTRVLPVIASNGCEIDFSFGVPGYEESMLARSVSFEPAKGIQIRICSAEDLIIHKAVAGRPHDLEDIVGVINRQGSKLDVKYIRSWLKEFSLILETDEVLNRFEQPYSEWQNFTETAY